MEMEWGVTAHCPAMILHWAASILILRASASVRDVKTPQLMKQVGTIIFTKSFEALKLTRYLIVNILYKLSGYYCVGVFLLFDNFCLYRTYY